jgi:hypothetical protein
MPRLSFCAACAWCANIEMYSNSIFFSFHFSCDWKYRWYRQSLCRTGEGICNNESIHTVLFVLSSSITLELADLCVWWLCLFWMVWWVISITVSLARLQLFSFTGKTGSGSAVISALGWWLKVCWFESWLGQYHIICPPPTLTIKWVCWCQYNVTSHPYLVF